MFMADSKSFAPGVGSCVCLAGAGGAVGMVGLFEVRRIGSAGRGRIGLGVESQKTASLKWIFGVKGLVFKKGNIHSDKVSMFF